MTPRWALKRALKWGVGAGTALTGIGALYRRTSMFKSGFRILAYHRITPIPMDSYAVKNKHFDLHMAYLADHHPVLDLSIAVDRMISGQALEEGSVAVTFDDGYAEASSEVAEILHKYGLTATFYLVTGILDAEMEAPPGPFLSWDQARHMAEAGFSIGSHTVTHRSLGEMDADQVRQELEHSFARIDQELGAPPAGLSYPYGTMRDFSSQVTVAAADVGYRYAVTAVNGLNHSATDPFALRRTPIMAGDGLRTFKMIMKGCLDPWHLVDRWAHFLQRPYETGLGRPGISGESDKGKNTGESAG